MKNKSTNKPIFLENHSLTFHKAAITVLMSMSALLISACSGNDDTNKKNKAPIAQSSEVSIRVQPASEDAVLLYKSLAYAKTTNKEGYARLTSLPQGERVILNVGKSGFALQTFVEKLSTADSRSLVDVHLLKLQKVMSSYSKTNQGDFSSQQGINIKVDANTLLRTDNTNLNKSMSVFMTDVDVNNEALLPHPFQVKTIDINKKVKYTPLEILTAVHFQIQENELAPVSTANTLATFAGINDLVELNKASKYSISIPQSQVTGQDDTVILYNFNVLTATWEKVATLSLNAKKTAYTGTANKTGYLAIAKPIENKTTLSGCVVDDADNRLVGAEVILTGDNYSGFDKAITNAQGNFSLTAKTSSNATVSVKSGQYHHETKLTSISSQSISNTQCLKLNIGSSDIKMSGKLTWSGKKDYDINVILPHRKMMYYNSRVLVDGAVIATEITENKNGFSEDITYKKLLVGDHFIFVSNFHNNFDVPMTQSNTKLSITIGDTTTDFTPPTGEVTQSTETIIDTRTPVWLAAIMTVDDACKVTISSPNTSDYKVWLRDYELAQGKITTDNKVIKSSGSKFCKSVQTP